MRKVSAIKMSATPCPPSPDYMPSGAKIVWKAPSTSGGSRSQGGSRTYLGSGSRNAAWMLRSNDKEKDKKTEKESLIRLWGCVTEAVWMNSRRKTERPVKVRQRSK